MSLPDAIGHFFSSVGGTSSLSAWTGTLVYIVGAYMIIVASQRMKSYKNLEKLAKTPPAEDDLIAWSEIQNNFLYLDFPTLATKSLEFGLLKSYAFPDTSKVLVGTKELVDNVSKRYDDTDLLLREVTVSSFV
jgi:hypothetical protein